MVAVGAPGPLLVHPPLSPLTVFTAVVVVAAASSRARARAEVTGVCQSGAPPDGRRGGSGGGGAGGSRGVERVGVALFALFRGSVSIVVLLFLL